MLRILLIAIGALGFIITALSLFSVNFSFGVVMLFGGQGLLILYGVFFDRLIRLKWLNIAILIACVSALIMMIGVGVYGKNDNATYREDALIILGAGIRGEQVSRTLARRLDRALAYLAENPNALVVVSGARGTQEDITEALAMERYLLAGGIPKEQIIKEEAATNTYENLSYTKTILDAKLSRPYRIVFVTNDFHVYRASMLAKKLGLDAAHIHAKTAWYEIPRNYLRECVAVAKVWIVGK